VQVDVAQRRPAPIRDREALNMNHSS
jgi:hypothetical protein